MQAEDKSLRTLKNLFYHRKVVELKDMYEAVKTNSRMTVFRRLRDLNYLSSYTHAGRYYTCRDIPLFDHVGLWHYSDIGFSRYGSLKDTIVHLVNASDAGETHSELEKQLRIRVHNTLLDLVNSGQINRIRVGRNYLYTIIDPERGKQQIQRRNEFLTGSMQFLPDWLVIEVLAEVIREISARLAPHEVVSRLRKRGVDITVDQAKEVFRRYNLKKKRV